MKTLLFILILGSSFFSLTAGTFTSIPLPENELNLNPPDKLLVVNSRNYPPSIPLRTNYRDLINRKVDTTIIQLDEVEIYDGFPTKSHDCLEKQIIYPEFARRQHIEGVVAVTMQFNSDGIIEILDSFGSDPRLENYVLTQLYKLHLRDCTVTMNKPYNLRFTFRLH